MAGLLACERLESRYMLAAPDFLAGAVQGTVESPEIVEASGLIASRSQEGVLWTHNDNGDSRLFAMNARGEHLGIYDTLVDADDWEDVAIGPGPQPGIDYIYVADTGDNSQSRSSIAVYRVAEPQVNAGQSPVDVDLSGVETISLRYPDGSHDAETLIVDPDSGDIYIISKRDSPSRIYRADYPQSTSEPTTLSYLGNLTWGGAVSGDISPDGDELILMDLRDAYYYGRDEGTPIAAALMTTPEDIPYTPQQLGEGLSWDARGSGYFASSEGTNEPLYYYERVGDNQPPAVAEVLLDGTRWTAAFREAFDERGAGYSIPSGATQLQTAPWLAIDQLRIRFDEPVLVAADDLSITGLNTPEYSISGFTYDSASFTATWQLAEPLRADSVILSLSELIEDQAGNRLDGDWIDGTSTFPSGDGQAGSDDGFRFRIQVLPGDVDADGQVSRDDVVNVLRATGAAPGNVRYDVRTDVNSDASINLSDMRATLAAMMSSVPAFSGGGSSAPLAATDAVFTRLGESEPPAMPLGRGSTADNSSRRTTLLDSEDTYSVRRGGTRVPTAPPPSASDSVYDDGFAPRLSR